MALMDIDSLITKWRCESVILLTRKVPIFMIFSLFYNGFTGRQPRDAGSKDAWQLSAWYWWIIRVPLRNNLSFHHRRHPCPYHRPWRGHNQTTWHFQSSCHLLLPSFRRPSEQNVRRQNMMVVHKNSEMHLFLQISWNVCVPASSS